MEKETFIALFVFELLTAIQAIATLFFSNLASTAICCGIFIIILPALRLAWKEWKEVHNG